MNIISKKIRNSIQFKFLTVMSAIILIGTVVSTIVITNNEKETFDKSLRTKGRVLPPSLPNSAPNLWC